MAVASVQAALRPYLPSDAPRLAAVFRAAIEELTGDDYSESQRAAWMASADDEGAFGGRLADQLTLVATIDGETVGFACLRGNDHIDMLYVHPVVAGRGVAAMLCDALEKLAAARGATQVTVDASDTALAFFQARGYGAERRNTVALAGEWLGNTSMRKTLAPAAPRNLQ